MANAVTDQKNLDRFCETLYCIRQILLDASKGPVKKSSTFTTSYLSHYLRIAQSCHVGFQIEFNPLGCTFQGGSANKQNKQNHIWKRGCEINNLEERKQTDT